jgi:hypothetical protein
VKQLKVIDNVVYVAMSDRVMILKLVAFRVRPHVLA